MEAKRKAKPAKQADGRSKRGKYEEWLTEDGLLKLEAWSRDGLTQADIAHNCGCSLSTLKDWICKYPAIADALKRGREVADIRVENALYKRAVGYDYEEVITEKGPKGVLVRTVKKHVPPSEVAAFFWLKNRKPEVWRDKRAEYADRTNSVEVIFDVDEEEETDAEGADPAAES